MNSNEMFNPDGTLSYAPPMTQKPTSSKPTNSSYPPHLPSSKTCSVKIPRPLSDAWDGVETIDVPYPPRALELIIRFIYPSPTSAVVDDLDASSEALAPADKYDVEVARVRLRASSVGFDKTEPLRAYMIPCRFRLTEGMKIASSRKTSIRL